MASNSTIPCVSDFEENETNHKPDDSLNHLIGYFTNKNTFLSIPKLADWF